VHDVLDGLDALIERRPAVALALLEHLIIRLDAAGVDDSDGGMVEVFERLEPAHANAAGLANEDPRTLGRRLAELRALGICPFDAAERTHAAVLGLEGLSLLRELDPLR
jgi:hypothetical protein